MVVLSDPSLMNSVYSQKLGFTVFRRQKRPGGYENAVILFPPTYIEFLFLYDRHKAEVADDPLAKIILSTIEAGGGPIGYNIDISPVGAAVAALHKRGMEVTLPPSQIVIQKDGTQVRGPWQFVRITKSGQPEPETGVPGGDRARFLEYNDQDQKGMAETIKREHPNSPLHANTARRMRSAWVAVRSASDAVKHSELFGFAELGQRESTLLGARGREVQCGAGTIVFWESTKAGSPLEKLIKTKGVGPFGASVDVADLDVAHRIVENGMGKKLALETSGSRKTFVVPGDLISGTWIEFGEA
jgi:hypothetical protein